MEVERNSFFFREDGFMPEQMITCSFCRKKVTVRDQYDMPIYDPNTGFAICKNCIKEIHHFVEEHEASEASAAHTGFATELGRLTPPIAAKPHGGLIFCANKIYVYCIIT